MLGASTVQNGIVFYPGSTLVRAYNAANGDVLWSNTYGGFGAPEIFASGNRLFVCSSDGLIQCLNAADGQTIWEIDPEENVSGISPVVVGDVLFHSQIGFEQNKIVARNANTGMVIWEKSLDESCRSPFLILDDNGNAFYSTQSGMQP